MNNLLLNLNNRKKKIIIIKKNINNNNNNNNKFTFVHPTKCGGTSVENFLNKYYSKYFYTNVHFNKCENNNNSILIVRDPVDRFKSMYKYWKSGSEIFIHKNKHIDRFKNVVRDEQIKKIFIRADEKPITPIQIEKLYKSLNIYGCKNYEIKFICYSNYKGIENFTWQRDYICWKELF